MIGKRLQHLRKARNLTLEELAKRIGTDPGNISRLERDKQGCSFKMLEGLALALEVTVAALFEPAESTYTAAPLCEVPIVDACAKSIADRAPKLTSYFVPAAWVLETAGTADALIGVIQSGDAMAPEVCDGDVVIVNTDLRELEDGRLYAFEYEDKVIVRRAYEEKGSWVLATDNANRRLYRYRDFDSEAHQIIGRVVRRDTVHV